VRTLGEATHMNEILKQIAKEISAGKKSSKLLKSIRKEILRG
jgi:hypothetical protein